MGQVLDYGYSVAVVPERLGMSAHSLQKWVKAVKPDNSEHQASEFIETHSEVLRLRAQLRRTEGERYIRKEAAVLCKPVRVKYPFIIEHRHQFKVATMCGVVRASRNGFYAWVHKPLLDRTIANRRLPSLIRDSYAINSGVYGAPRVFADLREAGESCGRHQVARIMREHKIRALQGYKAPHHIAARPSVLAPNRLNRDFTVTKPDQAWVTDITYIRTWQGWLSLAIVIDLFACRVVGWSMKPTLARETALDALLVAVWRRKPKHRVLVHSEQNTQYGSDDWSGFCREHNLDPTMSCRGNCWDNAIVESFFGSLKKERIKKRIYKTRDLARADIFDYIEMFYNRTRRHSHLGGISPKAFDRPSS